jgi:hypothetical protein
MRKIGLLLLPFAFMVIGIFVSTETAKADPLPANCQQVPWGLFGSQTRSICDGPIHSDGSWFRSRIIFTPAHYVPFTCYTSGSYRSSFTNCYGGYFVNLTKQDDEAYTVTPETVLPDEPGHLG